MLTAGMTVSLINVAFEIHSYPALKYGAPYLSIIDDQQNQVKKGKLISVLGL